MRFWRRPPEYTETVTVVDEYGICRLMLVVNGHSEERCNLPEGWLLKIMGNT
jgi:hypothetical protein